MADDTIPCRPGVNPPIPNSPTSDGPLLSTARVLVLISALSLVAVGGLAGCVGILISFFEPDGRLILISLSVSFMALTVGLGTALAFQTWWSIQGRESKSFRPHLVGIWALVFLLAVILGQAILRQNLIPWLAFPPVHVLASVLPPLIIIALAARSLDGVIRSREVVFQLSSGALLATLLAFVLEAAAILSIMVALVTLVAVQPSSPEQLQTLMSRIQDPAWLEDPGQLVDLARSPLVVSTVFLVGAVLIPLIEEAVKAVGVPLRAYRRPGMAQAFMWGLVCGGGFALAEGLFNSLGGLDSWAAIVSLRAGASLLHCFTGALMGIAWYFGLLEARWGRALGIYAASAGIHGIWNALVAGTTLVSLGTHGNQSPLPAHMAGLHASGILVLVLIGLALAVAGGLVGLTRYVRQQHVSMLRSTAPLAPPESATARPDDQTGRSP